MEYHNLIYLKQLRSDLRKRQTPAEEFLWDIIRNRKFLGKKFRRQHSFANYIFDFYCPEFQLVVELDGSIHHTSDQIRYDKERDEMISGFGFKILRFTNELVLNDLEFVLEEIKNEMVLPPPDPLLQKEGEILFRFCFFKKSPLLLKEGVGGGQQQKSLL